MVANIISHNVEGIINSSMKRSKYMVESASPLHSTSSAEMQKWEAWEACHVGKTASSRPTIIEAVLIAQGTCTFDLQRSPGRGWHIRGEGEFQLRVEVACDRSNLQIATLNEYEHSNIILRNL